MIEEERMEAKASHYGMLWACSICGHESDALSCPKCFERKHLEELREREACGYNGEVPYFEVKREPLYSYKIDQATWNSEEISIKNTHPLFNQIRKRLEKYDKRISLAGATQIEPIIIPSEHPLYLGIKRLLADVEKSVAEPCFVIGNLPNFESKKIEYERLGEQA